MNITECAENLLRYFSPEERNIPDSGVYPGRNAEVLRAINGALQELFGLGKPWVRKSARGALVYAPSTVTISVTEGSNTVSIAADDWKDRFIGCSIVIEGGTTDNRITNSDGASMAASVTLNPTGDDNSITFTAVNPGSSGNDITVTIAAPDDATLIDVSVAETSITATPTSKWLMTVTGTLTSDGSTPLTFQPMVEVEDALLVSLYGSRLWSADGTMDFGNENFQQSGGYWVLTSGDGTSTWLADDIADTPDQVLSWTPLGAATGTLNITASASTAQKIIDAVNADAAASVLVTASASGTVTGAVAAVAATSLTGGSGGQTLLFPHDGTSGTTTALIYCDSIAIGSDVLEVLEPVKLDRRKLTPAMHAGQQHIGPTANDFGFDHTEPSVLADEARLSQTSGNPMYYYVESWSAGDTFAPGARMLLSPAPTTKAFLEYGAMIAPPVITNIEANTADLPVPHSFVESIFMPIAIKRLSNSRFFTPPANPQSVVDDYQAAMALLARGGQNKTSRPRLIIKG